ncbi:MAG TPA: RNA polymerase Rpb4 [Nitrososphaeraceae archaeon]|nr:RNA polymerase Rpb4 [Nitrososphaeraceae archaeon]
MEILKREVVSLGQVKEILDKTESENMDQIQRWTLDYVTKFSKTSPEESRKIVEELVDQCDLKEEEAVEITNSMPSSIEELRAFTFGWKKLILTDTLTRILEVINKAKNKDS